MSAQDGTITVDAKYEVLTHTDLTCYSVRVTDWKRLGRALDRCKAKSTSVIEGAAWACFGVSASAVFSLISGAASTPTPANWLIATYFALFVGCGIVGGILIYLARLRQSDVSQTIDNVKIEMTEIEQMCRPAAGAPQ